MTLTVTITVTVTLKLTLTLSLHLILTLSLSLTRCELADGLAGSVWLASLGVEEPNSIMTSAPYGVIGGRLGLG